jgi:ribonucleoside-diphosphate reductase alpha chain
MITIEYLQKEISVYDITVEETHNFFANDILVHNCTEILLESKPIQHIDDDNGLIPTCILSGVNLGKIKKLSDLENICYHLVLSLDNIIEWQKYPIVAAEKFTKNYRALGLGFTNFAYYLAKHKVPYDSQEALQLTHDLSEAYQYYCLKASNKIAKERGSFNYFENSKYSQGILPIDTYKESIDEVIPNNLKFDWESLRKDIIAYGLRNVTLTAQFPSESSSVTSNSTNSIEPPRQHLSTKVSKKGTLKMIVPEYDKLKKYYTLAWDMKSNDSYIKIAGVIQKFFDQGISGNLYYNPNNFPENKVPTSVLIQDLLQTYKLGWKTRYYINTYDLKEDLIAETKESEESCDGCKL